MKLSSIKSKEVTHIKGKVGSVLISVAVMALALSVKAAPETMAEESDASSDEQVTTLSFWSTEAIATAPAMELPVDFGWSGIDTTASNVEAFVGPGGKTRSSMAEEGSDQFHKEAYTQAWENLTANWGNEYVTALGEPSGTLDENEAIKDEQRGMDETADITAGTKNVYTNYDVNSKTALWKLYPHRWMGKLTFTKPSGNSSCSATAIRNNHIVTAAHCVYDTPSRNRWYTNKVFTPAYRNGSAPYGTFPTAGCRILTAWANLSGSYSINSWARHDVAVCKMGKNSAGKTLNQAVGWAGYGWNFGNNQLHFNSGYPARKYTDSLLSSPAQYLRSCTAESFKQTTDTLGSGCYYGRGISGGSWLRGYKPNYVTGWVNSVNSGLYLGQSNLYGARFTSNNIKALCNANGC